MKERDEQHNSEIEDENIHESVTNNQDSEANDVNESDNLTDWENKYNQLQDSYLRLNAEFDNYRKRTSKEKAEASRNGSERVLIDIVNVVDDFERALDNISKTEDIVAVKEGIDLIYGKFKNFLAKHGVKEINTIGEDFDTDKHEAITTVPAADESSKDKIVDCIQKGYILDDKIIRYPKVIVAK